MWPTIGNCTKDCIPTANITLFFFFSPPLRIPNPWLQPTLSLWPLGWSSCLMELPLLMRWHCRRLCRMLVRLFSRIAHWALNSRLTFLSLAVLPALTGTCDQKHFYVRVKYGSQDRNFETAVGMRQLTPDLAKAYKLQENRTHLILRVPYNAQDSNFEVYITWLFENLQSTDRKSPVNASLLRIWIKCALNIFLQLVSSVSIQARLDIVLWEPNNQWVLGDLSLACSFPLMTTSKIWSLKLLIKITNTIIIMSTFFRMLS